MWRWFPKIGTLALVAVLAGVSLGFSKTGRASSALWQPAVDYKKAGNFCKPDIEENLVGRRGPREARYGSIVVRSYEQPLRALVAKVGATVDRRVPFGPSTIRIAASRLGDGQRLRVGGGKFGMVFVNLSRRSTGKLSWRGVASIASVDRGGQAARQLTKRSFSIPSLGAKMRRQILLPAGSMPGIYRFDLALESKDQKHHARFSDFVRVLTPKVEARLAIKRTIYRPGDSIYARVENLGSTVVRDSSEYVVEVEEPSGAWTRVGPVGVGFPRGPGLPLGPGRARCFGLQVPSGAAHGDYRLTKQIEVGPSVLSLTRDFSVE